MAVKHRLRLITFKKGIDFMNVNLTGKVAIITGGSGVLGASFTKALAQAGAKVVIIGRNLAKAQNLADELKSQGYEAMGVSANVLDKESLETARKLILETY